MDIRPRQTKAAIRVAHGNPYFFDHFVYQDREDDASTRRPGRGDAHRLRPLSFEVMRNNRERREKEKSQANADANALGEENLIKPLRLGE